MNQQEKNAPSRKAILEMIYENWQPRRAKDIMAVDNTCGRVTAQDVYAINTIPLVRASAMDGIAVRSSDFADGNMPDTSTWVYEKDYVRADTGDDFPDAFDAIIRIEDVTITDGILTLSCDPKEICPGTNVRPSGSIVKGGELVIPKGYRITPYRLAAIATAGVKNLYVTKKPKVTFIPTGNELIAPGLIAKRGENVEANSLMMRELVQSWGGIFKCMPIVRDQMKDLESALLSAVQSSDIVLINGGSSKGFEDYSITLLEKCGTILQHYVASAPGRPMCVALVNGKLVINVPGPTLAAFAVADWAVHSAISYFLMETETISTETEAILESDIQCPPHMEIYTRLIVSEKDNKRYAKPIPKHASIGDGMGRCNAILVTEPSKSGYKTGETIRIRLIG
jgi:molybdopterin molybdotransferase/putative molybdopterin biosynthesis protein